MGFGLRIESKRLFYHFQTFPLSNFSYGGVGIRLYKKDKERSSISKGLNLEIEMSLLNNGDGYNFKYSFNPFMVLNRRAKFIINHNYQTFLKRYIPDYPTINGHGNQITAGLEIPLFKTRETSRIVQPYTNLTIGNKAISIYSKEIDIDNLKSHHFVINNDTGIYIKLPFIFKKKSTSLSLSLYNRFAVSHSLNPENESSLVSSKNSPYSRFKNNIGAGIRFKI